MEEQTNAGQVLPLVALLIATCGLAAIGLGRLAEATIETAAATSAADAVALAGVVEGTDAARAVAASNDAVVLEFERLENGDVRVLVRRGDATARARARGRPGHRELPAAPLAPAMRAAVARARSLIGEPLIITAVHERGMAIDVATAVVDALAAIGEQAGLCRPDAESDPVRFELCGERFPGRGRG